MLELKVTGMTCNGCANSVKRAINRVYPNAKVEVDLATGLVRIDGEVQTAQAEESIEKAGYGVSSVSP
jgi:copper chaperone